MLVSVFNGEMLLEQRKLRPVTLPSGQEGVIWRGLAYPCDESAKIQVEGVAYPPGDCTPIGALPTRTQTTASWALIEGAEDSYIVVRGSVTDAEAIADALRGAGVAVIRVGRYLGDPVDGLVGDWFVRVGIGAETNGSNAIAAALQGFAPQHSSSGERPADQRLRLLAIELTAARQERDRLRSSVIDERLKAASAGEGVAAEIAELRTALAEEQRQRLDLETELASTDSAPRLTVAPPAKLQDEVKHVFQVFLSRIKLVRDSLSFITAEMLTRTHLYRALLELNSGVDRMPPNWKKLRGVANCWERHVSTGQDDAGRIYARYEPGDQEWLVLVSHKGDQTRDLAWISKSW